MKRLLSWKTGVLVPVAVFAMWLLGQMLLIHAVGQGQVGLATALVTVGFSPNSRAFFFAQSPAEEAMGGTYGSYRDDPDLKLRQLEIAMVLLDHGADLRRDEASLVRSAASFGAITEPLLEAAKRVLARVIELGGDVNQASVDGWTPLCDVRHGDLAELLLKAGAKLLAECGPDGNTPLHAAIAQQNSRPLAMLFISAGADPNARNRLGETPLFQVEDAATIELLVKLRADVNASAKDGSTPLHAAVPRSGIGFPGGAAVIQALVEHGARVDAKNQKSQTPLDKAIQNCKASLATVLIPHAPQYAARLAAGESPTAVASAVILARNPNCRNEYHESFSGATPEPGLPPKLTAPAQRGCTVAVHGDAKVEGNGITLAVSQDPGSGVRAFTGTRAAMFVECADKGAYRAWYHVRIEGDDGTRIDQVNLRAIEQGVGVYGLGSGGEVSEVKLEAPFKSGRMSWYVSDAEITRFDDAARQGRIREIQSVPLTVEPPSL